MWWKMKMFTFTYAKTSQQWFRLEGLNHMLTDAKPPEKWNQHCVETPPPARHLCWCCFIMKSYFWSQKKTNSCLSIVVRNSRSCRFRAFTSDRDFSRPFARVTWPSLVAAARLILWVFEVGINFQPWLSSSPSADCADWQQMACFKSSYFQHQECFFLSLVRHHMYRIILVTWYFFTCLTCLNRESWIQLS